MKLLLLIIFCPLIFVTANAQVGIGNTDPDQSSVLDISATDKGILIPRVSLDNVATTELDGVNTAATGLLIWNTNPATTGGSGVGFYYFNGVWTALEGGATADVDWYEQGSTNAPDAITDNIFTNGAVGINGAAGFSNQLNVSASSSSLNAGYFSNFASSTSAKTGIRTVVSGNTNASNYGIYNSLGSIGNTGILHGTYNRIFGSNNIGSYGVYNDFSGESVSNQYGVYSNMNPAATGRVWGAYNNIINNNSGIKIGTENNLEVSEGSNYGTYNNITSSSTQSTYGTNNSIDHTSTGDSYGTRNFIFGTGDGLKYGSYNLIGSVNGGTHIGVYADVVKAGSFAGYFRGDVAIGTSLPTSASPDYYRLPPSRGTANQIIQIDGAGIATWVDNPSLAMAENGLNESAATVRLGGALTQETTVDQGTFNLNYNLSNTGNFNIQDNGTTHFQVREDGNTYFGGEVIVTTDSDVTGNTTARLFNIFDEEGALYLYRNGNPQHRIDAGFTTVFNDQGVDLDFRIESDDNPEAFGVIGGDNVMYAGTDTVSLTNDGATVNGVTVEYVASFYRDDLTNGTAVQFGSTEYLTDFGNLIWGPYGSWAPYSDNTFDLGTSTFRWDDVYATAGVVNTSDIRLKKNIKNLKYGLAEILKLEPISYQWKNARDISEVKIGFSAQQLLTVLPEVVKTHDFVYPDENGPAVLQKSENLGVYYSDIIPVLTNAIQEQQALIENLNKRIQYLENNN